MKHDYHHIDLNNNLDQEKFFGQLEIPYKKSRNEIWAALEQQMEEEPAPTIADFKLRRLIYGIAASILLLAGIFSLLKFYTTSVYCPPGRHLSCELPDGSKVELNADSRIAYKPLWWRFLREVQFEGEGFFEVEKGKKFSLFSEKGRTDVLGTSFNIYSRNNEYKVTCVTGKVKLISFTSAEVVLGPEFTGEVNSKGEIIVLKEMKASESHAWTDNMFSFISRPLAMVFNEISRQYDIKITLKTPVDYLYTGYFTRNRPVEETLTLVCTPFELTFTRISAKEYEISQH